MAILTQQSKFFTLPIQSQYSLEIAQINNKIKMRKATAQRRTWMAIFETVLESDSTFTTFESGALASFLPKTKIFQKIFIIFHKIGEKAMESNHA